MHPTTAAALIALNRRFYENYGAAFASTRRRVQDGVRRVLALLPDGGAAPWLDLGCGSGALAVEWLRQGRRSPYLGLDFSTALLAEARAAVEEASSQPPSAVTGQPPAAAPTQPPPAETGQPAGAAWGSRPAAPPIRFHQADLSDPAWAEGLPLPGSGAHTSGPLSSGSLAGGPLTSGPLTSGALSSEPLSSGELTGEPLTGEPLISGALAFAVFHHLPSHNLRLRILQQVRELLPPGGWFAHSEWQFQHSPKLMERRLPWSTVGLDESALEPGDTLLDWRHSLPGQPAPPEAEGVGLRYVHLFTLAELDELARAAGFRVLQTFESDGKGGRLGLYQVWEKT